MYVPPAFSVDDRAWVLELIARYPFGLLVTTDADGVRSTHLPMLARSGAGGAIALIGHVARANPHAKAIAAGAPATAIFQGSHAYVSASWYEEPYTTVPTWNYTAVHAAGRLHAYDARAAVVALSQTFERGRPQPWDPQELDPSYFDGQLRGIVAFELPVERLDAKAKLSQNRTAADRLRVTRALEESPLAVERECAQAMRDAERG